jgi:hypothetical protein
MISFNKDGVLMGSKNISEDLSTGVSDRMPQPARVGFLSHKAPHLVQFRLLYAQELNRHVFPSQARQESLMTVFERGPFFNSLITVVGLAFKTRAVSRMPRPLRVISMICCLISGKRPLYRYFSDTVLPEEVRVTVVADRGFVDSKLFVFLSEALGFDYLIRLRANLSVETEN